MHELPVAENILKITLRHAEKSGAQRVTGLYLVIGQLASVVDDSLQFYWDFLSEGTLAEGAILHFQRIPAELQCLDCGHIYKLNHEDFACPQCRSQSIKVTSGEEFYLDSIDIE